MNKQELVNTIRDIQQQVGYQGWRDNLRLPEKSLEERVYCLEAKFTENQLIDVPNNRGGISKISIQETLKLVMEYLGVVYRYPTTPSPAMIKKTTKKKS